MTLHLKYLSLLFFIRYQILSLYKQIKTNLNDNIIFDEPTPTPILSSVHHHIIINYLLFDQFATKGSRFPFYAGQQVGRILFLITNIVYLNLVQMTIQVRTDVGTRISHLFSLNDVKHSTYLFFLRQNRFHNVLNH